MWIVPYRGLAHRINEGISAKPGYAHTVCGLFIPARACVKVANVEKIKTLCPDCKFQGNTRFGLWGWVVLVIWMVVLPFLFARACEREGELYQKRMDEYVRERFR